MGVSSLIALVGIGIAGVHLAEAARSIAEIAGARVRADAPAAAEQVLRGRDLRRGDRPADPGRRRSEGLWRGFDVRVIDGAVNGTATIVAGSAAVLRRLQTGSVRTYAGSLFVGVVVILGYYLWR